MATQGAAALLTKPLPHSGAAKPWGALSKPLPGGLCRSSAPGASNAGPRGARKTYTQNLNTQLHTRVLNAPKIKS